MAVKRSQAQKYPISVRKAFHSRLYEQCTEIPLEDSAPPACSVTLRSGGKVDQLKRGTGSTRAVESESGGEGREGARRGQQHLARLPILACRPSRRLDLRSEALQAVWRTVEHYSLLSPRVDASLRNTYHMSLYHCSRKPIAHSSAGRGFKRCRQ